MASSFFISGVLGHRPVEEVGRRVDRLLRLDGRQGGEGFLVHPPVGQPAGERRGPGSRRKYGSAFSSFRIAGTSFGASAAALRAAARIALASALPSSRRGQRCGRGRSVGSSVQILSKAAWSNLPAVFSHASAWALAASGVAAFREPNVYSALGSAARWCEAEPQPGRHRGGCQPMFGGHEGSSASGKSGTAIDYSPAVSKGKTGVTGMRVMAGMIKR